MNDNQQPEPQWLLCSCEEAEEYLSTNNCWYKVDIHAVHFNNTNYRKRFVPPKCEECERLRNCNNSWIETSTDLTIEKKTLVRRIVDLETIEEIKDEKIQQLESDNATLRAEREHSKCMKCKSFLTGICDSCNKEQPQLPPLPAGDGWVRHDGKKQPVSDDTVVEVVYRESKLFPNWKGKAECVSWKHREHDNSIFAYRIVAPPAPAPPKFSVGDVITTDDDGWVGIARESDIELLNTKQHRYRHATPEEKAKFYAKNPIHHPAWQKVIDSYKHCSSDFIGMASDDLTHWTIFAMSGKEWE